MLHWTPSPLLGGTRSLGSVSKGARPWQQLVGVVVVLLLLVLVPRGEASPARLCRGIRCFNGGSLEVHGSLWGSCRCVCPSGFAGMTCQYWRVGKREAPSPPRPFSFSSASSSDSDSSDSSASPSPSRYSQLRSILQVLDNLAQTLPTDDWLER